MKFHIWVPALFYLSHMTTAIERKKYPYIPLCCTEFETYNGTDCVDMNEDLTLDKLPVTYGKDLNNITILLNHKPLNCSNFIELPLMYKFSQVEGLIVERGLVILKVKDTHLKSFPYYASEFCLLKYSSEYLIRICTDEGKENISNPKETLTKSNFLDCKSNICITKCCSPTQHVSFIPKFGCHPNENSPVYNFDPAFRFVNGSSADIQKNVNFIVNFPLCKLYDSDKIHLLPNGSVYLPTTKEHIHRDKYCIDLFRLGAKISLRGSICSETLEATLYEKMNSILHPIGLLISCIFLAVTFICHVIIPKLRDLQGLCFMCYVAILFVGFLLLCLNHLIQNKLSVSVCVGLAVLNHFSLMASFFWLNVMCFDIWKIIRGTVKAIQLGNIHSNTRRTFIVYSIYAWGTPFVVSLAALILHLLPEGSVSDYVIRPHFNKPKCFLNDDIKVLFAYYNGIISVLFLVNIFFIIHTSTLLYRSGVAFSCCRTRTPIGESDDIKGNKRLLLNMFWHRFCLFALMALNWTTEVLSFIPPLEMWIVTDFLNTLQGLFIFILFIRSTNKRLMLVEAWHKVISTAQKIGGKENGYVKVKFIKDGKKGAKTKFLEEVE